MIEIKFDLNRTSDVLLQELSIEEKIREELKDSHVYFEFDKINEYQVGLSVITISKNHNERFLFHKTTSISKIGCLKDMLTYIVSDFKKNLEHYEIIWCKKGEDRKKSWFYGKSFLDVIDKFYYQKDPSEILIYSIQMNPLS